MGMSGDVGCYTDSASGPLVSDPRYGTAIIDRGGMNQQSNIAVPVAWRPGFSDDGCVLGLRIRARGMTLARLWDSWIRTPPRPTGYAGCRWP
jgi:hypothetical protein